MVVVARVDLVGAVIARLRAFPELCALVGGASPRISGVLQDAWAMPTSAIVVRKAGGPNDILTTAGRRTSRVDITAYGSTGYNADRVWSMLDAVLVPSQGTRASFTVTVGGLPVRVNDVMSEAEAISDTDPVTAWPFVWCPYLFLWWADA